MGKKVHWFLLLVITLHSCGVIRDTPKYSFADGMYHSNIPPKKRSIFYIENTNDSIIAHPFNPKSNTILMLDSQRIAFPQNHADRYFPPQKFNQASFDLDFLTIPFKYRPQTASFPRQFNTNLNGAVYFGYRNDSYRISFKKDPVGRYNRQTTHYGLSFGLFNGFGGTAMNPWVTANQIVSEYDGVVWSKGIAGIIGIDNFTIGLSFGWDNLLDGNKKFWLYQNKPWFGLAFGLNLN